MSINDSEIEDAISQLGEIETDEDVTTDTGDSDDTEETLDSSTSSSSSLEIVRSYANNSTNTEREMGGNCMVCYIEFYKASFTIFSAKRDKIISKTDYLLFFLQLLLQFFPKPNLKDGSFHLYHYLNRQIVRTQLYS